MAWKPRPRADVDVRSLPLRPIQGFLLSRLDGASDVAALAQVTGLPLEQVTTMLGELVSLGAVEPEPGDAPPAEGPPPARQTPEQLEPLPELPETEPHLQAQHEASSDEPPPEAEPETGTHRALFESALHDKPVEERVALAHTATEPTLSALCFDPQPKVVVALMENPNMGLQQARLVARHHRTTPGLEALVSRPTFANDAAVRHWLVRNPQLAPPLFKRLWQARPLHEQYVLVISRELPQTSKRIATELLRARFANGPSEERVQLIVKTEARCLTHLTGIPIDSRTTALLCGRTYGSTTFVQNLARWSAAPPALIAHLFKQDVVRRSPQLRLLLQRHPNAPRER
ncbi:MAG: hypothetical protein JNJ54_01815 [Myxococcaceae bacterium]|nr:hypothetical protein [Myxococcaceae bacterium]